MRSHVKTGDVIQIRRNGPNYIALGKVVDREGNQFIATTRNGNVTQSGKLKRGTGNHRPKIQLIYGGEVKRVHGNREVDMESVVSGNRRVGRHLQRTTRRTGVVTDAPNIMEQLHDLQASL